MATTRTSSRRPASSSRRSGRPGGGRPEARNRRRSWLWRYRRVLFLFAVLGATALAGLVYVVFQVPLPSPPDLSQTTFLSDANGQQLAVLHGNENRVSVGLDQVPPVVQQAVVATEDRKFFRHSGVDPVGLVRATWADVRNRNKAQGGSTITQQYVKNTYVGRERSFVRKLKEAVISVKLERKLGKKQILERYLNTIYFGRGAYGVQAASQAYYGKDVGQLGLREAVYLAGLIRAPQRADAITHPDEAARRRDVTLRAMQRDRYITAAQAAGVAGTPFGEYVIDRSAVPTMQTQIAAGDKGTQYFVEYVRRYLVGRYGEKAVLGGGLRVKTTLDLRTQAQAYDSVYGLLRESDPRGALVALDPEGRVKAMVGGRDWEKSKVNLAVGREGGGRGRQGGSTFKPFVLAEAVKEGYTVESSFKGPAKITLPKANNGADWTVSNYEGEAFDRVNLIDATEHSINTVYAQLVTQIGPDKVVNMAKDLGIQTPLAPHASITLGTQDVSVLEMADAYLTFANRGVRALPHVVSQVTDANGHVIESFRPERSRVLDRSQADVVNFVLRQVVEHGTGTGAQFGRPAAGKTGTTQDYGDAWFIGYTPRLTAAVWMGYPEGQSRAMLNVHGKKVNGGSFPATIFKRFMTAATKDVDTGDFPAVTKFPGKVLRGDRIQFKEQPAETGDTTPSRPTPASTPPSSTPGTTSPNDKPSPTTSPPSTAPPQTAPPRTSPPTTRGASPPSTLVGGGGGSSP